MIWETHDKYSNKYVVLDKVSVFYSSETTIGDNSGEYKDIAIHVFIQGCTDDFIFYYNSIKDRDMKLKELRNMTEIYYDRRIK